MTVRNLSNIGNIQLNVPDPQLLQGWEFFTGAILYAERGKKYLILSETPEIRLPEPRAINGEILFIKYSSGIATLNPQTHTVEGSLAFTNESLVRAIATDEAWGIFKLGSSSNPLVAGGGGLSERQILLSSATQDFLYQSGLLTVGLRSLQVSIAKGFNEAGNPIDTLVNVQENSLAFPGLPTNTTVYFWVDSLGNLGYTENEPIEVDELPQSPGTLYNASLIESDQGEASAGTSDSGHDPWHAFDGDPNTFWGNGLTGDEWLEFNFGTFVQIKKYAVTASNPTDGWGASYTPSSWEFQGWTGSNWVVLDSRQSQTGWSHFETREYLVPTPGDFLKYRLFMSNYGFKALSLDLYAQDNYEWLFVVPEKKGYLWDETLQQFTPSPRIFMGEADTDGTQLTDVRPYILGTKVHVSASTVLNTNTSIKTNLGSQRALYFVSLPLGATSGGLISWNRTHVIVRANQNGKVLVSGMRLY